MSSPGVATVYRWELRKLRSQKRTYMGFAIAIAIPLIFVIALALQNGQPEGILFGRYVRQSGFNSLTTLSGTKVGPAKALGLVAASLGVYLLPMLSIAAIGLLLSTITRNSAAAVVGALMIALVLQIGSIIPGLEEIRPYLLPRQFDAWQGLLREPTDWAPIVRAAWVCAAYAVPCLAAAYLVFLRRDVAGG